MAWNALLQAASDAYDAEDLGAEHILPIPSAPSAPLPPPQSHADAASLLDAIIKTIPPEKLKNMKPQTLLRTLQRSEDPQLKLYSGILQQILTSSGLSILSKSATPQTLAYIGNVVEHVGLGASVSIGVVALAALLGYRWYKNDQAKAVEIEERIREANIPEILKTGRFFPD